MRHLEVSYFFGSRFIGIATIASIWLVGCRSVESDSAPPTEPSGAPAVPAQLVAEQYIATAGPRLGLSRPQDFKAGAVSRGGRRNHVRMKQLYRGVPVFGGETIVHVDDASNQVAAFSDSALREITVPSTDPHVGASEAIAIARATLPCPRCVTAAPKAELFVLRHNATDHLAWKVDLKVLDGSDHTAMPVVFVDANDGTIVWTYDNLQTGTGASLYSGNVSLTTYAAAGGPFYLEDVVTKAGTFNYNNGTSTKARFTDVDDVWESAVQRAGVDAQFGAVSTLRYFKDVHGRNGIDGNWGPTPMMSADGTTPIMTSGVHYSSGYSNAFWDGTQMTYGDGDGTTFTPLVPLDIVGHEITHGVTEHTANLIYSGESGALNESISDVFGAMVERSIKGQSAATWMVGEDCYTPGNGNSDAPRHFANPHLASDKGFTPNDDPDHYSERYLGPEDNGGVHINSGIANHAFYLTAVGGTHHLGGSVVGIGADAAAAIWFLGLTSYMTSTTDFEQGAIALYHAAQELYGDNSVEAQTVLQAWALVGVTADAQPPTVTITAPSGGATVSETVIVTANATDNIAVKQVDLFVDGVLAASDATAPYELAWLTGASGNGPHVLTAKAYDGKNNSTTSAPVNVVVANETVAPVVELVTPKSGAVVMGNTPVTITASDNVAVATVQFKVDGAVVQTFTAPPYAFSWNTASLANGAHTLLASATDKAGNTGTSAPTSVTIGNPGMAVFDASFKAPRCATVGSFCDTNALVVGRANLGPELNHPNTLMSSCTDDTSGTFHSDESLDRVRIETTSGNPFAPGQVVNVKATVWAFSSSNVLDVFYASNASTPNWIWAGTVSAGGSGLRTLSVPVTLASGGTQAIRAQFRYGGSATPCEKSSYNDRDDVVFAVQGSDPTPAKTALLVVGAEPLDVHDAALQSRLTNQLGFQVTVKQAATSTAADAAGKSLVFISETVASSSVGSKFTSVAVPVVTTEPALFDDLGLVDGAWDTAMGAVAGQTSLQIVDATSPLSAGLSGTPTVVSAPCTFVWGTPNANAKIVARLTGSSTRAAIFTYETGAALAVGTAPARRVAFFANSTTPGVLTVSGWALFDAAVTWSIGSAAPPPPPPPPPPPLPPPTNQAPTVNAGQDRSTQAGAVLTLTGQVSDDGLPNPPGALALKWTSLSGPQTPQWPQNDSTSATTNVRFDVAGTYILRLTANDGALSSTDDVQIVVTSAPAPSSALFIVGSVPMSAADGALAARLQTQHGLTVVTKTADASTAADAAGVAFVLISETVSSGAVNTKFTSVTVPVINLEPALQDELGMTSAVWDTGQGSAASQTSIVITAANHPLAAGLSGQPTVVNVASNFGWGQPAASAQVVATLAGASNKAAVYAYAAGATMVTGTAPARRVCMFPTGGVANQFNANGWALFDAAVTWVK